MNLAIDLLRKLASGIVPSASASQPSSAPATGGADFSKLLSQAQAGELKSNQPVTISPRANIVLNSDQLQRLSAAADRAQAAGLTNALVMLDGKPLLMDVHTRQVTGVFDASSRSVAGIDGVVAAPGAVDAAQASTAPGLTSGVLPLPGGIPSNLSLARILQSVARATPAA